MMCGQWTMAVSVMTGGPGTGDLPGKISEELLVCKICYGRFMSHKLPKLLACSHTFCEPCVLKYYKAATASAASIRSLSANDVSGNNGERSGVPSREFPCPLCRKCTLLPEGGVEKLANNFTILSLMEILDKQPSGPVLPTPGSARYTTSASSHRRKRSFLCSRDPADSRSTPGGSACDLTAFFASCVAEKCVVCDKKYPESELPCGHCICVKCSYEVVQMEQLSHPTNMVECPRCGPLPSAPGDEVVEGVGSIMDTCTCGTSSSLDTINGMMDSEADCGNLVEVGQGDASLCSLNDSTLQIGRSDQDSLQNSTENEKHESEGLEKEEKGEKEGSVQDEEKENTEKKDLRPPPYNPRYTTTYVDNPLYGSVTEMKVQQQGQAGGMTGGMTGGTMVREASMRETVLRQQQQQHSPKHSLQGSPKRACHPLSEAYLYYRVRTSHTYDSPYHFQDDYDMPGHPYESPYALRRTQSLRRPPMPPPRRQSSSPGLFANLRLKKRSSSCPAQPTDGKNPNYDPNYQSPAALYGVAPPVPPPRRFYDSPTSSPVRCVKKFGKYSDIRFQTSAFRQPTKVAVSEQGDIVVVDVQGMTVQVFTWAGDYLSMFKVIGVQGAGFFSPDKLAIATHRGVEVYTIAGEKLQDLSPGLTVNTAPFKFGFLACMPKSVLIYRQSLTLVKEITKRKTTRPHLFRKNNTFENLTDIAVLTNKHIALLDAGKGTINIIDEDSVSRMTINPALESCGKLKDPESLTVDRSNNIYVADTGNQRVLKFSNSGAYSKCILTCKTSASDKKIAPYGVAATDQGNLIVVISGDHIAEVRIYQLS